MIACIFGTDSRLNITYLLYTQFTLVAKSCPTVTPWIGACQASLSITNSRSSLKLVCPLSQWCHPAISSSVVPFPPAPNPFSNESTLCMMWPKYWSFSFNISPSIEHPGLISFKMNWLDLLAVQGILKSLLQQHSSKASCFIWINIY